MTSERDNPFHIAQQQFDTAAALLDLPQDIREVLRVPQRELTVRFPVRMDDSSRLEASSAFSIPERESLMICGMLFIERLSRSARRSRRARSLPVC